jgi:hypothetical protein
VLLSSTESEWEGVMAAKHKYSYLTFLCNHGCIIIWIFEFSTLQRDANGSDYENFKIERKSST